VYLTYRTIEVTPRKTSSELFTVFDQLVYVNHMKPALNCPYKVSVLVKFGTLLQWKSNKYYIFWACL